MKNQRRKTDKLPQDKFGSSLGEVNIDPPRRYREEQRTKKTDLNKTEIRRRQSKKRRLKNSVRKALVAISLLIVLIAVSIVLSLTVFFKIDTINITGSGVYSSEEVLSNCDISYGDNLFMIKKDVCKERLTRNLPYIYDVKITRKLPATVQLEITDAKVQYVIDNENETFILLDDNFKVLDNASAVGAESAVLITNSVVTSAEKGVPISFEDEAVSDCLSKLSQAIKTTQMTQATSISSTDVNNNYIIYDGRITFALGSCDDIENKIYKGLAACEKLDESSPGVKGIMTIGTDKQIYFTAD